MIGIVLGLVLGVGADSVVYRGDTGEIRVRAPRLEAPDIRVDGRLEEGSWGRAAVLTGFTQHAPLEGLPATQETEVRVLYGPEAIYFGIVARDDEPSGIRSTLRERDQDVTDDDWVRISLDTFNDRLQAYVFYVNPRGVQADGLWIEGWSGGQWGPPIDFAPDFLWESDARITAEGWMAEVRIPFGSLRFRGAGEQAWALNVVRSIRRTEYQSAWAPITQDAANPLELSGLLVGLEGLEPKRLLELNPVVTGSRTGEADAAGAMVRGSFAPAVGVNGRVGLTRDLVLDATVNPDFSQVEADAGQVVVNERFALFFPERRPFFLEGTEIFTTPQRLVYTRAVVDPVGGAKLTGRVGGLDVGYLGALDESPITFGGGDAEAAFNLVRVRSEVGGSGSSLGALYTDRTLVDGSGYNRVGAVDTRLVLGGRYSVTAQVAGSWTADPGDAGGRFGQLLAAEVSRSGRTFSWEVELEDVDPEFRARSGFIRRVGDTRAGGELRYTVLNEAGSFVEDYGVQLEAQSYFDHGDFWAGRRFEEAELSAGLDLSLRGPNGGVLTVSSGYFDFDPSDYVDYEAGPDGAESAFEVPGALTNLLGVRLWGRTEPVPWLGVSGSLSYGEVPIYAEAGRGRELVLRPTAGLRFPFGLTGDLSFTYARIERDDGSLFSTAQIPRARLQYQFTRALFARAIVQYDLQERDLLRGANGIPLLVDGGVVDPLDEGEVQYDLLLSFEPSPGTILYAGWSRLREGPRTYRFGRLEPTAEGLFLKVSYLFRL